MSESNYSKLTDQERNCLCAMYKESILHMTDCGDTKNKELFDKLQELASEGISMPAGMGHVVTVIGR